MMRKLAVGAVVCSISVLTGLSTTKSSAQAVWGGGGVRVRAPFVRVDVTPDGGVSVRAPFTAVDVPPRDYYYGPAYPPPAYVERRVFEPLFPSAADFAAMDDEQLNQALPAIAQSLHNRLSRFDTGHTWQRYLRLPEEVVDASTPPEARAAAIATLLGRFQKVAADPQFSMIARLPAFVAMEAGLNEALSRPANLQTPSRTNTEDLPLPKPEQPVREGRDDPFLKPKVGRTSVRP